MQIKNIQIEWVLLAIIVSLILIYYFFTEKENFIPRTTPRKYNYYANWNYSPYYTPLPVDETSYMKFYDPMPALIDRWLVR